MPRKILLLITVLIFSTFFKSQILIPVDEEQYLKNIRHTIKTAQSNTVKLENYLLLSEYWAQKDKEKSKEALSFVLQSPYAKDISKGVVAYYQGVCSIANEEKDKAQEYFQKAIQGLEKDAENRALYIKAIYQNSYIQIEEKGYDSFVKTLTSKCIPISEHSKQDELLAFSYTQLGLTFMSVGQLDKAEVYHKKALQVLKQIPQDKAIHLITYLNLVSNYCYKPDSKSAKVYLDKAKALIQRFPDSQYYSNYYYQEALYFTTKQNYIEALASLNKGVALAKAKKQNKMIHMLYFRMYNVYLMQKDYVKAKQKLEQILSENILSKEEVNRRITYTQLAAVNEVMGNYKDAYQWMKKSGALNDSIQQKKLLEKMNELEILHHTSEKEKTIQNLRQEKKENELVTKNKNLRITILAIALGLSLVIGFLIYLTYRKEQKLIRQINISHQQDLLHLENEKKYEATKAVLQGEEQERQRIAQDLHDSMGGMLANIRMSVSSLDPNKSTDIAAKIDRSISEMRRISRNLMPETLKNLGLEIALRELCESMSHKHFSIQFEAFDVSDEIPFQTQLSLYRIAQESISNVIKYAQADNVIVQISENEKTIQLTIEDDGIGFNASEVAYGLGLKNIKNRVQLINGTVDIISSKGEGTTINVECKNA